MIGWSVRLARVLAAAGAVAGLGSSMGVTRAAAAAQPCPATAPTSAVPSPAVGAQLELVPPGAVSATLCRFRGLNDPGLSYALKLAGSATVTDGQQVQTLGDQFNALPPFPTGAIACPADDGSSLLAIFEYPHSPADPVLVSPTGCSSARNGYVTGYMAFAPGQELRVELQRLTGCPNAQDNWFCDSDPVPSTANPGATPKVQGLTGCANPQGNRPCNSDPLPSPPALGATPQARPRDATVVGYVRRCGGPAPGGCLVKKLGVCRAPGGCTTSDRIAVIDDAGRRVATRRLQHARFLLRLAPGRYTIELLGDGKQVHGRVMQTKTVTATAHRTDTVVFLFAIP